MKKLLTKHWPLIGIGVLLVVVSVYLFRAQKAIGPKSILTDFVSEEGLTLKNIHYAQDSPDDDVKWILDAKEVKFSKDRKLISFRDFRLKLEPQDKPPIQMEGKRGDYNKDSGEINLRGDLIGHTDYGYKIFTEHLSYRQKEGYLTTEGPVKIIGPFFSVDGQGLHFNLNREDVFSP